MVYHQHAKSATMKIAFISYWSCPLEKIGVLAAGGMNIYIRELSNYLGKSGHKVDIYTRTHPHRDESIFFLHKNVRIIHLSQSSRDLYKDSRNFGRKLIRLMQKEKRNYDIVHAHYYYSGLIGLVLRKKLSIPMLITFHTLELVKKQYTSTQDSRRIQIEKDIADQTDAIISSTEIERKDLINFYHAPKNKIYVVSPGVDHHLFRRLDKKISRARLNILQDKNIILFVGRIDPVKDLSLLIRAIAGLVRKKPSFTKRYELLIIGGDLKSSRFWVNREVKKIRKLISDLDLSCCVKFLGARPHHLLPYYYCGSDVIVVPSVYESFGLVALEAMACGCAILASRVGGLKYLIADKVNGRLFKSGDEHDLAGKLLELLQHLRQRKRLGLKAIYSSQNYCWSKQSQKMLAVYNKFIR